MNRIYRIKISILFFIILSILNIHVNMFYIYELQTMAGNAVLLKDVIRVNPRFQRSVHLEKDYHTRGQDQDYSLSSRPAKF